MSEILKVCPHCRCENGGTAERCTQCGSGLVEASAAARSALVDSPADTPRTVMQGDSNQSVRTQALVLLALHNWRKIRRALRLGGWLVAEPLLAWVLGTGVGLLRVVAHGSGTARGLLLAEAGGLALAVTLLLLFLRQIALQSLRRLAEQTGGSFIPATSLLEAEALARRLAAQLHGVGSHAQETTVQSVTQQLLALELRRVEQGGPLLEPLRPLPRDAAWPLVTAWVVLLLSLAASVLAPSWAPRSSPVAVDPAPVAVAADPRAVQPAPVAAAAGTPPGPVGTGRKIEPGELVTLGNDHAVLFPGTLSRDGRYAVGWTLKETASHQVDWTSYMRDEDAFMHRALELPMADVVVDLEAGRLVAELKFEDPHFAARGMHKNHGGLSAMWSEEVGGKRVGLVENAGRWSASNLTVLQITPTGVHQGEIARALAGAGTAYVEKQLFSRDAARAAQYAVQFDLTSERQPALKSGFDGLQTVFLPFSAAVPKSSEDPDFAGLMTVHLSPPDDGPPAVRSVETRGAAPPRADELTTVATRLSPLHDFRIELRHHPDVAGEMFWAVTENPPDEACLFSFSRNAGIGFSPDEHWMHANDFPSSSGGGVSLFARRGTTGHDRLVYQPLPGPPLQDLAWTYYLKVTGRKSNSDRDHVNILGLVWQSDSHGLYLRFSTSGSNADQSVPEVWFCLYRLENGAFEALSPLRGFTQPLRKDADDRPEDHPASHREMLNFLRTHLDTENTRNLPAYLADFDDPAGVSSEQRRLRSEASARLQSEFSRWPRRRVDVTSKFQVSEEGQNRWVVSYSFRLRAESDADPQGVESEGWRTSVVERGSRLSIVKEFDAVTSQPSAPVSVLGWPRNTAPVMPLPTPFVSSFSGEHYPETRQRVLSAGDAERFSPDQLRYALNEMYARHGADFKDPAVKKVFAKMTWYHPRAGKSYDEAENEFSALEKQNVDFLGSYRAAQRGTPTPFKVVPLTDPRYAPPGAPDPRYPAPGASQATATPAPVTAVEGPRFRGQGTVYKVPELKNLVGKKVENAWLYGSFVLKGFEGATSTFGTLAGAIEGRTQVRVQWSGGIQLSPNAIEVMQNTATTGQGVIFNVTAADPLQLISVARDRDGRVVVQARGRGTLRY